MGFCREICGSLIDHALHIVWPYGIVTLIVIQENECIFYAHRMEMDGLHHAFHIMLFAKQRARNYSCCCMLQLWYFHRTKGSVNVFLIIGDHMWFIAWAFHWFDLIHWFGLDGLKFWLGNSDSAIEEPKEAAKDDQAISCEDCSFGFLYSSCNYRQVFTHERVSTVFNVRMCVCVCVCVHVYVHACMHVYVCVHVSERRGRVHAPCI